MSFLARISNLWKISKLNIEIPEGNDQKLTLQVKEPRKLAQIIKRTTPVEDFMNKNKHE